MSQPDFAFLVMLPLCMAFIVGCSIDWHKIKAHLIKKYNEVK
jgi:hypothetical protein